MDDWEKFKKTFLPEKEDFYSHLNIEKITDADYTHTQKSLLRFWNKLFGEYHDVYVQSNTLLLVDVFKNLEICLELY